MTIMGVGVCVGAGPGLAGEVGSMKKEAIRWSWYVDQLGQTSWMCGGSGRLVGLVAV